MSTTSVVQTAHQGVTAGVQVMPTARPGILRLVVLTPAAANATIIVYDNTNAASGTQLANIAAQTPWSNGWDFFTPFSKGLFVVVTGTGADATITWE